MLVIRSSMRRSSSARLILCLPKHTHTQRLGRAARKQINFVFTDTEESTTTNCHCAEGCNTREGRRRKKLGKIKHQELIVRGKNKRWEVVQ